MSHDNETPCSSVAQDEWQEIIKALRQEVKKRIKPKMSIQQIGMLAELTDGLMQLEVYANSLDELMAARKVRLERKLIP